MKPPSREDAYSPSLLFLERKFPSLSPGRVTEQRIIHTKTPLGVRALNIINRTSLVAQWLRICLPMLGTRVREPWSGKIPHAVEQLSPCSTTTEPVP